MSRRRVQKGKPKTTAGRKLRASWSGSRFRLPKQEVAGLVLLAVAALTALGLSRVSSGALLARWAVTVRRLFGWGAFPITLSVAFLGLRLLWREFRARVAMGPAVFVGLELLLLLLLVAGHAPLVARQGADAALAVAEEGRSGGYVGWALAVPLVEGLGPVLTGLVLFIVLVVSLILLLPISIADLRDWVWRQSRIAAAALNRWWTSRQGRPVPPNGAASAGDRWWEEEPVERRVRSQKSSAAQPERWWEQETPQGGAMPAEAARPRPDPWWEKEPSPDELRAKKGSRPRKARSVQPVPRDGDLPPLDLLSSSSPAAYGDTDVRLKSALIEETLASFGVPARVVEVNQGPTVTQFGLDPGYIERRMPDGQVTRQRVRVARIAGLAHDLALALAASPVRIEAPVPGRSIVGLEVPNQKIALVSLRRVIESAEFQSIRSRLAVALGENVAGQPVAVDLAAMPHLLIAGATGSGKSVCVNAIVCSLLLNNRPDQLRMLMVDPKMVELVGYNGIPHLLGPVVVNVDHVVGGLAWVTRQMDERYKLFHQVGVRNLEQYNRQTGRRKDAQPMPVWVVFIDELADLMMVAPDEVERHLCRLAQLGRATGIHLVVATQRPSVDVVTGLIKANFPARISFAVTSQIDSRVILDQGGAENLLGKGDMLFMSPQQGAAVRLQGCFVSDPEIGRLTKFWRSQAGGDRHASAEVPWAGIDPDDDTDDLVAKAMQAAKGKARISTSFLQRQLRIGFPRAARLMEELEEQGLVGPDEGAGRGRQVLVGKAVDLDEIAERPAGKAPRA